MDWVQVVVAAARIVGYPARGKPSWTKARGRLGLFVALTGGSAAALAFATLIAFARLGH